MSRPQYPGNALDPKSKDARDRLRAIRLELNISRPDMAAMLDIPPPTLKNYENGYREIGGNVYVAMFRNQALQPYLCYLLADVEVKDIFKRNMND